MQIHFILETIQKWMDLKGGYSIYIFSNRFKLNDLKLYNCQFLLIVVVKNKKIITSVSARILLTFLCN